MNGRPRRLLAFLCFAFLTAVRTAIAQPAQRPYVPLFSVETNSPAYQSFKAHVDRAVAGDLGYDFDPFDAAVMYRLTGESQYASLAISLVDREVVAAEAEIAAGRSPDIAGGQYLYVAGGLRPVAVVYDWMHDLLTPSQRTRWADYAEQTIYNVWHPEESHWHRADGSTLPAAWAGWSVSNPGNNYHYSFLRATVYWALADNSQVWKDFLRNQGTENFGRKTGFPFVVDYLQTMEGGGSREGTYYGNHNRQLFESYRVWKDATGEDFMNQSPHARDSIDYWIHETVPTLDFHAPIGDQARVSEGPVYDYDEHLMMELVRAYTGTPEAERGEWWLNHNSVPEPEVRRNRVYWLLDINHRETRPAALVYYARGAGHLFARTSWNRDATWLSFVAGRYDESHAHQDQGSFSFYKEGWLAFDANTNSRSGIEQGTEMHNLVRFERAGTIIRQRMSQAGRPPVSMTYTDTGGILTINADLSNAYNIADVGSWKRDLVFNRNARTLRIHDVTSAGGGVSAVWQANVDESTQPTVTGNIVTAGRTRITVLSPPNPHIQLRNWASLGYEVTSGWRVELSGATEYDVELGLAQSDAVPPGKPQNLRAVVH